MLSFTNTEHHSTLFDQRAHCMGVDLQLESVASGITKIKVVCSHIPYLMLKRS
jgi:hypothetical protein